MFTSDADYFLELQTQTGWGRTLFGFAHWCDTQPGWRTLDVGCGPGLLPAIFARSGCKAAGVDINIAMFHPVPLHPDVAVADAINLPFVPASFDLVTMTNLLFLLPQPSLALYVIGRLLRPGGKIALLNPSENLNKQAADDFANEQGMEGTAREALMNWAERAQAHHRWTEDETRDLFTSAGLMCMDCILKVGPGFGRFSWGRA